MQGQRDGVSKDKAIFSALMSALYPRKVGGKTLEKRMRPFLRILTISFLKPADKEYRSQTKNLLLFLLPKSQEMIHFRPRRRIMLESITYHPI